MKWISAASQQQYAYFHYSPKDYEMQVETATLRVFIQPTVSNDVHDKPVDLMLNVYGIDKNGQVGFIM